MFQFTRSLAFVEKRRWRTTEWTDVASWLAHLRERGVDRLWADIPGSGARQVSGLAIEAHQLMAFSGAGTWQLLAGRQSWRPQWAVADPNAPDRRIWDVRYHAGPGATATRPSIQPSTEALRAVLVGIQAFADARDLAPWTGAFAAALAALDGDDPEPPYQPDLVPAGVFGGMGSWNDLGFEKDEDQHAYRRLSRELYEAVLVSVVAAVNVDL